MRCLVHCGVLGPSASSLVGALVACHSQLPLITKCAWCHLAHGNCVGTTRRCGTARAIADPTPIVMREHGRGRTLNGIRYSALREFSSTAITIFS